MLKKIICLFVVFGACLSQQSQDQDEYVLNFESPVLVCPDDVSMKMADTSKLEVTRHNETFSYISGIFTMMKTLVPCTIVEVIVEKSTGGRTEVMVTHEICDMCAEMHPDSVYYKYFKNFGFPEECPVTGIFQIERFQTDPEDMPLNRANEAQYQATVNFFSNPDCECKDDRTFLGCLRLDFVIEPVY